MARLNLIENSTDNSPDKQFQQIQLALQEINNWSQRSKNNLVLNHSDISNTDISFTSQSYVPMKGLVAQFSSNSSLVQYIAKVYIDTDQEVSIGLFIDNSLVNEIRSSVLSTKHTIILTGFAEISSGISQTAELRCKLISAGTITKYVSGKNKIQIISLNN